MKLLVVGAGEMGRWFAGVVSDAFADADPEIPDADPEIPDADPEVADADLAFADADPEVAEEAASELGGRAVSLSTEETFDTICVAVPISAASEAIEAHAERADRALVDVTGEMAEAVATMQRVAPERERLSLHPLFSASSAPGNVAVVADEEGPVTDRILDALAAAGNELVETTPQTHDEAMQTVQTKTHAAVLAFALAADEVPEGLTTPVFEELRGVAERVAGNTPEVYAEIQETFDGSEEIADAAAEIADADAEEFAALYRRASSGPGEGQKREDDS